MGWFKRGRDRFIRFTLGEYSVPRGLFELSEYFRQNGSVNFELHKEDGEIVAVSTDFRCGSIITSGKSPDELDKNIRDAILTMFDVPSSYEKEAGVARTDKRSNQYALA